MQSAGLWCGALFALAAALGCDAHGAPAERPAGIDVKLVFSTYWGSGAGTLRSAVFDADGNLYVSGGTTNGTAWPKTRPALGPLGHSDVQVAKFSPDGRNVWSIVLGGSGEDYAYVSALDRSGNLLVGGRAGPEFPVTLGAFDTTFAGGFGRGPHLPTDGFLACFSPDGELRWATYIGSSGDDVVRGIEVLPDGGIAVSGGNTDRGDLPTSAGTLGGPVLKPTLGGKKDAWIGVIEADGASARFLSYFGPSDDHGRGDETVRTIGVDRAGRLWLAGTTEGSDLAPSPDAFQPKRGAGGSAFIAKLTPDGRQLSYFSWLGGSGDDSIETEGGADGEGALYVAGSTSSADFPTTPGAEHGDARGGDGIVARIEDDGRLGMAASFGGSGGENFFGPVRQGESIFVSGTTTSRDLPVTSNALQPRFAGGRSDALFAAFDASGAVQLSTYFGGSDDDAGRFVAADAPRHRVALVLETKSRDMLVKNAAQSEPAGAFVVVFEVTPAEPVPASSQE